MDLPGLALQTIKTYLSGREVVVPANLPIEFINSRSGAFVSIHLKDGSLRGCIGTILPTKSSIAEEVIANAISAAMSDSRFRPITKDEISQLEISVDVLSPPEEVQNTSMLDPKRYGVIVSTVDGRQGILLPDLPGVETISDQLRICMQKGGIAQGETISVRRFTVTRYLGSTN